MPFIITEPQLVAGTKLGFAVYPYEFSFDDHIDFAHGKYDEKLMIFRMKDTPFHEVDHVVHEEHFLYNDARRGFVDGLVKNYVDQHPEYVTDAKQVEDFFSKNANLGGKGGLA